VTVPNTRRFESVCGVHWCPQLSQGKSPGDDGQSCACCVTHCVQVEGSCSRLDTYCMCCSLGHHGCSMSADNDCLQTCGSLQLLLCMY